MTRAVTFTQAQVRRAVKAAESEQTFIYFLRAGEFVKIGQSKRWRARREQMQIGSPYTIVPLLVLISEPKLEKKLHNRFRADHFRGEWFHMGPAISAFIKENLSKCVAKSEESDLRVPDLRIPELDVVL